MSETIFLRLLSQDDKAAALSVAVGMVREGRTRNPVVHVVDPASFCQVPGSPFAYWVGPRVRRLFDALPRLEASGRVARRTNGTTDDARWIRASWEVSPLRVGRQQGWVAHAKGGAYSPYYDDLHLLIAWDEEAQTYPGYEGTVHRPDRRPASLTYFFRPGITWPRRSQRGLSFRVYPAGCIFGDKGPAIFAEAGSLPSLLGLTNSAPFQGLVTLQMAFGSYEAGVIQRTPVPDLSGSEGARLGRLALVCVSCKRALDRANETTHVFHLPALLQETGDELSRQLAAWHDRVSEIDRLLGEHQREIDDIAFDLYGMTRVDRLAIKEALNSPAKADGASEDDDIEFEEAEAEAPLDAQWLVADLLSYAVGCAFGRWDVRFATGERPAPELPDPFAPLPVCSPGMLTWEDGLPRRDAPSGYPLRIDWDGILVDDPGPDGNSLHQDDIVRRVRDVFEILWGDRAGTMEQEACEILGVKELRDYFRNPRGFFEDHIKRYSKSRRKAPIYWLLQSGRKSYGLWLYYHRLDRDTLFKALQHYVDPKIREETARLKEMKSALDRDKETLPRRERTRIEKEIERQDAFITELGAFREALARVAALGYDPDLNDGVVLNIAPLYEVTPWKEARAYWDELRAGKYAWSTMSRRLHAKEAAHP